MEKADLQSPFPLLTTNHTAGYVREAKGEFDRGCFRVQFEPFQLSVCL